MKRFFQDLNFQYFIYALFFATMFSPQTNAQSLNVAQDLGGSDGAIRLGIFTFVGICGMFAHYGKMWLRDEIAGGLWTYLFHSKPKSTILALFILLGADFSAFLLGQLDTLTTAQLILTGFMVGYTCDSALNDGDVPDTTVKPIQIVGK